MHLRAACAAITGRWRVGQGATVILVGAGVVLFVVVVVVGWGGGGVGELGHCSCGELLSRFLVESFAAGHLARVG